jgi:hypothetical protein
MLQVADEARDDLVLLMCQAFHNPAALRKQMMKKYGLTVEPKPADTMAAFEEIANFFGDRRSARKVRHQKIIMAMKGKQGGGRR